MALIIFRITRSIICAILVCLRVIYHDSVTFPILKFHWGSVRTGWRFIQSFLTWFICSMVWICCNLWNGLRNFYVRIIFDVMCHGNNNKHWGNGVMKYSYSGIYSPCDVTWNSLCGSHDDYGFYTCVVGIVTLICCAYICPSDGVWKLTWHGALCWNSVSDDVQVCLVVVSYLDSPLLYDHIHCIQNIGHLDSVMLYDLTPDTENSGPPCDTLHLQWMQVTR